jgi:hypothetical protein
VLYAALADPFRIAPSPESASDGEREALGLSAGSRYRIGVAHLYLRVLGIRLLPKMRRARPPQGEKVQARYAGCLRRWLENP